MTVRLTLPLLAHHPGPGLCGQLPARLDQQDPSERTELFDELRIYAGHGVSLRRPGTLGCA